MEEKKPDLARLMRFLDNWTPPPSRRKNKMRNSDQKKDPFSFIEKLAPKKQKRKGSKPKNPEPVDKAPAQGSASLELGVLKSAPYSIPNISDKKLLTLH